MFGLLTLIIRKKDYGINQNSDAFSYPRTTIVAMKEKE